MTDMQDLNRQWQMLSEQVKSAAALLRLDELKREQELLSQQSQQSDFWQDTAQAQKAMKQLASLDSRLQPWTDLIRGLDDVGELIKTGDTSLQDDLEKNLAELEHTFDKLKSSLKLSGPFDDHDAIVSIHAGAGGTDAQDWAQMLYRMYHRWAESEGLIVQALEESIGEEAGLKSVTFTVDGPFAYGKLKGEHGVHRLVRLSPFNADNLRQTSFAKIEIVPKIETPDEVAIDDKDIKIDVFRSGGHGGQSVNTTDSAVRITHQPTGIVVAIQNERSQLQNKETALTILRSKLAQLQLEQHQDNVRGLKGPNEQAAWGNQIRSYVLHPYKQVKDLRTKYETSDAEAVLDGKLDPFIDAYLESTLSHQ